LQPRIREMIALRERMNDLQDQRYDPEYKTHWQKLVSQDEQFSEPEA